MAFRRRWRFRPTGGLLRDHARADDAGLPARPRDAALWKFVGHDTSTCGRRRSGANVIWGIPFGFLVMLAVWNRYDRHIEEAARDLGANATTTFRRGDASAGLDGDLRQLPVRLHADLERLRPHVLLQTGYEPSTLPLQIGGLTFRAGRSGRTSTRSGRRRRGVAARDRCSCSWSPAAPALPRDARAPAEEEFGDTGGSLGGQQRPQRRRALSARRTATDWRARPVRRLEALWGRGSRGKPAVSPVASHAAP